MDIIWIYIYIYMDIIWILSLKFDIPTTIAGYIQLYHIFVVADMHIFAAQKMFTSKLSGNTEGIPLSAGTTAAFALASWKRRLRWASSSNLRAETWP